MSILNDVIGSLGGKQQGINLSQVEAIWEWVQEQGGIEALYQRFQQGGLVAIAASWLSSGPSKSLSSGDVRSLFGDGELFSLATRLGTDVPGASGVLAKYLPTVIGMFSGSGKAEGEAKPSEGLDLGNLLNAFIKR